MRQLLTVIDRLSEAAAIAAAIMMVAIVAMMLGEIGARVFRQTLPFAWEYGAYLNGAIFFLAAAYTTRTAGHIKVEWTSRLPRALERTIEFAATGVALALSLFLSNSLTRYAYESYAGWVRSDTVTATPLVYPKGALALGAVLLTLQLIARLIRIATGEATEIKDTADAQGFER